MVLTFYILKRLDQLYLGLYKCEKRIQKGQNHMSSLLTFLKYNVIGLQREAEKENTKRASFVFCVILTDLYDEIIYT